MRLASPVARAKPVWILKFRQWFCRLSFETALALEKISWRIGSKQGLLFPLAVFLSSSGDQKGLNLRGEGTEGALRRSGRSHLSAINAPRTHRYRIRYRTGKVPIYIRMYPPKKIKKAAAMIVTGARSTVRSDLAYPDFYYELWVKPSQLKGPATESLLLGWDLQGWRICQK